MDAHSLIIANQENSPPVENNVILQKLDHVPSCTVGFTRCCYNDSPASSTSTTEMLEPVGIISTNEHDMRTIRNNVKDKPSNPDQSLEIKDELCFLTQQQLQPFEDTSLNELKSLLTFLTPQQIDCMLRIHKIKRKDDLMYLNIGQLQKMGISEPKTVLALMEVALVSNLRKQEKDKNNRTTLNTSSKVDVVYVKSDVGKLEGDSNMQLIKDVNCSQETLKDDISYDEKNNDKALALQVKKDFGYKFKKFLTEVNENVNKVNDAFLSIKVKDLEPTAKFEKLRSLYECIKYQENLLKAHWQTFVHVSGRDMSENITSAQILPVCSNNKESPQNAVAEKDCALLVEDKEGNGFVIGNKETEHKEDDTNCILLPPSNFLVSGLDDHELRSSPEDYTKSIDISRTQHTTPLATNEIVVDISGSQRLKKTDGIIKEVKQCASDATLSLKPEEISISQGKQDCVKNRAFQKIEVNRVEPFDFFPKETQVKDEVDCVDKEKSPAYECRTTKDITTSNKVKLSYLRRKSPRFHSDHRSTANGKKQKSHESPKRKTQTFKPRLLRLSKRNIMSFQRKQLKYSVYNDLNKNVKNAAASPTSDEENQQAGTILSNRCFKTENTQKSQRNFKSVYIDLDINALQSRIGESNDNCNKSNHSEESNCESSHGERIKATEMKSNTVTTTNVDPRLRISYKNKTTFSSISEVETQKFTLSQKTDDHQAISKTTAVKRRSFEANEDMPPTLKACIQENEKDIEYKVPSPTGTVLRNIHEGADIDIEADRNCKATLSDFSLYNTSPTHTVKREISFESSIFNTTIIALPTNAGGSISSPSPVRNDETEQQFDIEIDGRMRYPPIPYILYEIDLSQNVHSKPLQINKLIKANALDPRVFRNQSKEENVKNLPSSTCYQIYDTPAHVSSSSTTHAQTFLSDPRNRSQYRDIQPPLTAVSPQPSAQNAIVCYNMNASPNVKPANVMSHPMATVSASPSFTQPEKPHPFQVLYHYLNISPWYQRLMTFMKMEIKYTLSHLLRALYNFQQKRQYDPEAIFDIFKIECCGEVLKILSDLGLIVEPNGDIVEDRNSSLYGVRPSMTTMQQHAGTSHQRGGETMQQHEEGIRGISTFQNTDRFLQHMMNPSAQCASLAPGLGVADCLNEPDSYYLETPQPMAGYGLCRNHVPPASPISKGCCCGVKTKYNYSNDRPCQRINDTSQSSSYNHCYNNNSRYSKPSSYDESNTFNRSSSPPEPSFSIAPRGVGRGGGGGERLGRFKERRGGGGGGGYGTGRQSSNCASSSYSNRRFNNNNYTSKYNNNSPSKPLASPPTAQQSPLLLSPSKPSEREGSPVRNSPVLNSPAKQQQYRPTSDDENWD